MVWVQGITKEEKDREINSKIIFMFVILLFVQTDKFNMKF